jgi:uncharacterized protein with FMN-binding domain
MKKNQKMVLSAAALAAMASSFASACSSGQSLNLAPSDISGVAATEDITAKTSTSVLETGATGATTYLDGTYTGSAAATRWGAIRAQSAGVRVIGGATSTSEAFMQSLDSALSRAL